MHSHFHPKPLPIIPCHLNNHISTSLHNKLHLVPIKVTSKDFSCSLTVLPCAHISAKLPPWTKLSLLVLHRLICSLASPASHKAPHQNRYSCHCLMPQGCRTSWQPLCTSPLYCSKRFQFCKSRGTSAPWYSPRWSLVSCWPQLNCSDQGWAKLLRKMPIVGAALVRNHNIGTFGNSHFLISSSD